MLYYRSDKGHVQNIGAIMQEFSHYIMWRGNFDPTRVMYETIIYENVTITHKGTWFTISDHNEW